MPTKSETFNKSQLKENLPEVRPGDFIRIYQKIQEGGKERLQPFEGTVLARKHGKGISATITIRNIIAGVGVEKIIPLHSPNVKRIEILKRTKTRRAKLYYLRKAKGKRANLKSKELKEPIIWEEKTEVIKKEKETKEKEEKEK